MHFVHTPIFDDIHAHRVYVQKAQLIFPTTRKRSVTIWYAIFAFILTSKSQLILIHLIFDYQSKYVLNAVKFFVYFPIFSNPWCLQQGLLSKAGWNLKYESCFYKHYSIIHLFWNIVDTKWNLIQSTNQSIPFRLVVHKSYSEIFHAFKSVPLMKSKRCSVVHRNEWIHIVVIFAHSLCQKHSCSTP